MRHTHASPGAAMIAESLSFTTTAEVLLTLGAGKCTCMRSQLRLKSIYPAVVAAISSPQDTWTPAGVRTTPILGKPGSQRDSCGGQAAVTPIIGSAGAIYNRVFLTAAGTVIWGATSAGIALASTLAKVRRPCHACRISVLVVKACLRNTDACQPSMAERHRGPPHSRLARFSPALVKVRIWFVQLALYQFPAIANHYIRVCI